MTKIKRLFAICTVTLLAGTAACVLLSRLYPVLRRVYDELGPPYGRTYLNRDMSEWLRILALTNFSKEPLQIIQITCDRTSHIATVEVPLAYELLSKYGFLEESNSKFDIAVNGYNLTSVCSPGTNGGCLLEFDTRHLDLGTNQLSIEFIMSNRTNAEFICYRPGYRAGLDQCREMAPQILTVSQLGTF